MTLTKKKQVEALAIRLDVEFGSPFPLLEEVSMKYLKLKPEVANRRANEGEIPFTVTRITDSAKSPKCVSTNDLAEYLINRQTDARKDHIKLRSVV